MKRHVAVGVLVSLVGVVLLCSVAAYVVRWREPATASSLDTLLLLIPDSASADDPNVRLWLDAASEEGLHLAIVRDSELLKPTSDLRCAGLIMPDEVHRRANDALIGALYRYVERGGKLMLVYDAATWDLQGHFIPSESRLSGLVGVHYALYERYGADTMQWGEVWGDAEAMRDLAIPPGKFVPLTPRGRAAAWRPVSLNDSTQHTKFTFARYRFDDLQYPSFHTSGNYDGRVLLQSEAGLVAGERAGGAGRVLFVNLPLSFLENRTDGLLLHSFLRYFASRVIGLPYLSPVPNAVGGLVLNWHIDTRSALGTLERMHRLGLFGQGPFSEHITAGPDVTRIHDNAGVDLEHNPEAQRWLRFFVARGDAIGSHGGWIHNYFGTHVNETNDKQFAPYLERNTRALEKFAGTGVREYSAPLGNQPAWITRWLEEHGFVAYYFAGDSGMGPTQVYRDGVRDGDDIWAFPILHMGKQASLEEMQQAGISPAEVREWLLRVTDYTTTEHVARLIYSHPFGSIHFEKAVASWFEHSGELERQGRFRWYTMTQLADFLNTRKQVQWIVTRDFAGTVSLEATHPRTLAQQAWCIPDSRYGRPSVLKGAAQVRHEDGMWVVTASDGPLLKMAMKEKK